MKKLLLAMTLALAPAAAPAQTTPAAPAQSAPSAPATAGAPADADPALWVVRDEDTTIYLFGTFHMLDERPWFNDEVRTAFEASDELVLEARLPENPADIQPLVVRYALDQDGPPLSERLTAEQYAELNRLIGSVGAPAGAFDRLEPWFVSITLPGIVAQQQLGLRPEHGPETVLSSAAQERDMSIGELEGIEWQFRLFDEMPVEQQVAMLGQTFEDLDNVSEQLAPMLDSWSTGNLDGLAEMMTSTLRESPELYAMLFTNRNRSWAQWIQERMARPGTVFLAVGAGHLAGSDSVQAQLQALGVGSERIAHQEAPVS